jgi:hypothetical protein
LSNQFQNLNTPEDFKNFVQWIDSHGRGRTTT